MLLSLVCLMLVVSLIVNVVLLASNKKHKEAMKEIKKNSDFERYAELKNSNDVAIEAFEELADCHNKWVEAYENLVNRYNELNDEVYECKDNELWTEFFLEYGPYGDIRKEHKLYVVNDIRASNVDDPITMEELERLNFDISAAVDYNHKDWEEK